MCQDRQTTGFFYFETFLPAHSFLDRKSTKKGENIMIISRKNISRTVLLITFTLVILFCSGIYPINSEYENIYSKEISIDKYTEDVNNLTINGNINNVCDSLKGVCGPPAGW